jgi:hypothetical protein
MKFIRQLGFLRLPWDPVKREGEDDRLVHLFRNRAELKKAYSGVQDEVQRLKDRIKQQKARPPGCRRCCKGSRPA